MVTVTETTYERATVEQALRVLGAAGPTSFEPSDVGFAAGCVALLRQQVDLGVERRAKAYRMLERYRSRLAALGIDYDQMVVPERQQPRPAPAAPTSTAPTSTLVTASSSPAGPPPQLWIDPKGRLCSKTSFTLKEVIRQAPAGRYMGKGTGIYTYPATTATAEALFDLLAPHGVVCDAAVEALVAKARGIKEGAVHKSALELPAIPITKTDAWLHQQQAFWFAKDMPAVQLDMEMGTGKSKVVVDLIANKGTRSGIIFCPERVVGVWPKQFRLHSGIDVHIIDPRRETKNHEWKLIGIPERVELYDDALNVCGCGRPHILMSNYAAMAHEPFKSWSLLQMWDFIGYDESHKLKGAGGVWSKHAAKMVRRSGNRLGGTGTLMPQSPEDVYGQMRALDPGIFGTSFKSFQRRYFILGGYKDKEFRGVDPYNEDEFISKIASVTYRVGAEVLDLPDELDDVRVTSQLEPSARRIYRDIEKEMFAELLVMGPTQLDAELAKLEEDNGNLDSVTADNVLVKTLRLQQITGGALKLDSGETTIVSEAKKKLLLDDLDDISASEPVVVFARFRHDLDVIEEVAAKLKRPYAELSGRRSDALTQDATLSPDCTIAGVQLQSGGTGIDFTRSAYATYYSMGYSLGDYLQSRARLRRPGQTRSVRFRHLVLEGTIDETVYAALEARETVAKHIGSLIRRMQEGRA